MRSGVGYARTNAATSAGTSMSGTSIRARDVAGSLTIIVYVGRSARIGSVGDVPPIVVTLSIIVTYAYDANKVYLTDMVCKIVPPVLRLAVKPMNWLPGLSSATDDDELMLDSPVVMPNIWAFAT